MIFFSKHLSLNKASLAFLGLLSVTSPAFAEVAARVTFITGQVLVIDSNNNKRAVYKGDLIRSGEKIETANGRVQVRMTDGSIIVLRPHSLFEISKYSFSKNTPELGTVLFNFIKGGARAISGAIGKVNRLNYQFKTPVATIGIRGTDYAVSIVNDETVVTVNKGAIELANQNGSAEAEEGTSYSVTSNTKPELCYDEIEDKITTKSDEKSIRRKVIKPCAPVVIPLETEDGFYFSKEKIKKPLLENFSNYGSYAEAMRQYKILENDYILAGGQLEKDDSFTIGLVSSQPDDVNSQPSPFDNKETLDTNAMRGTTVLIGKYNNDIPNNYVLNPKSLDPAEMRDSSIVSAIGIQPESAPSLLKIIELKDLLQKRTFSFRLNDDLLSNNPNIFDDNNSQNEIQQLLEKFFAINTQNFLGSNVTIIGADFGQPEINVTLGDNAFEGVTVQLSPNVQNKNYLAERGVLSPKTLAFMDTNNNGVFSGFSFRQGLLHDNDGIASNRNSGSLVIGNGSLAQSTVIFNDDNTPVSVNLSLARGAKVNTLDERAVNIHINTPKLTIKLGDIYVSNSDSSAANIDKNGASDLGASAVLGTSNDGGPDIRIMGPSEITLGAATINTRLQHNAQTINNSLIDGINIIPTVTILADAFIREGLAINHIELIDAAGSVQGGSIMLDSLKITDNASPNLTAKLAINIEESGKGQNATVGGLLITLKQLGDALEGIDIAMNNLRVGTSNAANIGDIQIIGLNINGSHITLRGH